MKTNKSYLKRIRVTKHGKLITRAKGQNHFNAKQSPNKRRGKRHAVALALSAKARQRFLPGSYK